MGSDLKRRPLKYYLSEKPRNGLYKGKEFQGSGSRWIKMNEIFSLNFISDNETSERIEVTNSEEERFSCNAGDLLFGRTSLTLEGVGDCLLVQNITDAPIFESNLFRLRFDTTKASSIFFYYLFKSYYGRQLIQRIAKQTAATSITASDLIEEGVPAFSLSEQIRIADIIHQFDLKITLNCQINQTLEQMSQALFKSWFVDFDPVIDNALDADNPIPDGLAERAALRQMARTSDNFQPLPDDVRQLFPNEFEESELGWIPKGWESSTVGAEFDVTMGQSPPGSTYNETGEGAAFFQGKTDFGFRFPVNRIYCTEPKRVAKKNDTLVSVRAPVGAINLASENCSIGRGLSAVRHHSGSISYTYYAMENLSKLFEVFEGEGTVFGSINQKDFKGLPQIKASLRAVKKFDELCLVWDQKIELNSDEIESLTKLRDTLLPKLISGELRLDSAEVEKAKSLAEAV